MVLRYLTAGESHGKALGAIVEGCPAGLKLDEDKIRHEMQRRKPGQSKITTQRKEDGPDNPHDQHDQAGQYAHAPFTAMMNQAEIRADPELLKTLEQRWFGSH